MKLFLKKSSKNKVFFRLNKRVKPKIKIRKVEEQIKAKKN